MKNQAPFFIFVIMNNDFCILIIGFITAFVSVNTIIYFYLKYKRKIFFNYIKSRNYALVEKVETTIEAYSKISTKLQYRKSDIVFLDKEIFILTYNRPIIHIGTTPEIFPSVFQSFTNYSKVNINDRLEIKGNFTQGFIEGNYKISLNFKGKNFDLEKHLK